MLANVWYDKLDKMPPLGSIQSFLAQFVWSRRQRIKYHQTFVLAVSAFLDSSQEQAATKLQKAWAEYSEALFPYIGDLENAELEKIKKKLESMDFSPLVVKPLR